MEDANILEMLYLVVLTGTILVVFKQAMTMIIISFTILSVLLYFVRKFNKSRSPVDNKTVFITGAESDLGQQLSKHLVDNGFHVLASAESEKSAQIQDLQKYHKNLEILEMDITSQQSSDYCLSQVKAKLGGNGLYGLINCNYKMVNRDIELTSMDEYQQLIDYNILGTIRVTKLFLPLIRLSKGCIVNISSTAGLIGLPQKSAHTTTQFALEGFTESLRLEMKKFDVRVSIVECSTDYNISTKALLPSRNQPVSEDILETYGEEYINSYQDSISKPSVLSLDLSPISERVLDCLLSQRHTSRHLVYSKLLDKNNILSVIRPYLPLEFLDYLNLNINAPVLDTEYEKIKFGLKSTESDRKTQESDKKTL